MNMEKMTTRVQESLQAAQATAQKFKAAEITELHFLYALLPDENIITTIFNCEYVTQFLTRHSLGAVIRNQLL